MADKTKEALPCSLKFFEEENLGNLMKVRLKINRTGKNHNYSKFSLDSMKKAEGTLKNIPILGYIKQTDDDSCDFDGHNIITQIQEDSNGYTVTYKYLERPIGVIPETNNIEYVEEDGETYCCCDGYIWKSYANEGYELLKNSDKSVSMEIRILDSDVDEDWYEDIKEFEYLGVTVLGDDVPPAIQGASITSNCNFNIYKSQLEEIYNEIQKINEGGEDDMSKSNEPAKTEPTVDFSMFEELLGKVPSTVDELFASVKAKLGEICTESLNFSKDLESVKGELTKSQEEVKRLQAFEKQVKEKELEGEVNEMIAKYSLEQEEVKELSTKVYSSELTMDAFEKELVFVAYNKMMTNKANFSANEQTDENDDINVNRQTKKTEACPYGDTKELEKYLK